LDKKMRVEVGLSLKARPETAPQIRHWAADAWHGNDREKVIEHLL